MPRAVIGSQEHAWDEFDGAVWRAQALGWHFTAFTNALLTGHWERAAARMGQVDRFMWGPTIALLPVNRVTQAVKVAGQWDDAIVASGILDLIAELEHEGRTNQRLADTVADWRHLIEGARDAMANACVELLAATLVAAGGGARPTDAPAQAHKMSH